MYEQALAEGRITKDTDINDFAREVKKEQAKKTAEQKEAVKAYREEIRAKERWHRQIRNTWKDLDEADRAAVWRRDPAEAYERMNDDEWLAQKELEETHSLNRFTGLWEYDEDVVAAGRHKQKMQELRKKAGQCFYYGYDHESARQDMMTVNGRMVCGEAFGKLVNA